MAVEKDSFSYIFYSEEELMNKIKWHRHIVEFLSLLTYEYPGFKAWFSDLFKAEWELKNEREIIICCKGANLAGIIILKKDVNERKICTLRVAESFKGLGIGKNLIALALEWLECEKPLITLRKSKKAEFESIFDFYGFQLEQKNFSYYKWFSTELAYNGELPPKSLFTKKFEVVDWQRLMKNSMIPHHIKFEDFANYYFLQINQGNQVIY